MKKTFLTLFALIAMGGSAMAGEKPVISVADVEALPGETVSFSVNLVDGKADTYTAMTLYAQFPIGIDFTTTGNTVSQTWEGASGSTGAIDDTGLATLPFASENHIPGSAVNNLVTVKFKVGEGVPVDEYEVTLKGTLFEYNADDKDYADDVTFTVKVVERHTVILDEMATTAPEGTNGKSVDVIVKRTIKANSWSTICLPFAMTETEVKAAFGDDVKLGDFNSWSSDEDNEGDIVGIQIGFAPVSEIKANHPYMIKVSSEITEFTVDDVDIDPEDEPYIKVGKTKAERGYFTGTYVADFTVPQNNLFLNGNKFWYSNGTTKMKAFRAYFELADVLSEAKNASARISFNFEDDTTSITEVHGSNKDAEGTYDLQGRKVEEPVKGLYIVNGRKVVKK